MYSDQRIYQLTKEWLAEDSRLTTSDLTELISMQTDLSLTQVAGHFGRLTKAGYLETESRPELSSDNYFIPLK